MIERQAFFAFFARILTWMRKSSLSTAGLKAGIAAMVWAKNTAIEEDCWKGKLDMLDPAKFNVYMYKCLYTFHQINQSSKIQEKLAF